MNVEQIQAECDRIAGMMVAKGLIAPDCHAMLRSGSRPSTIGSSLRSGSDWERDYIHGNGDSIADALADLASKIAALPSPEKRHQHEFLRLIATAADYGRAHGIDAEFVNPLIVEMKRLSANAIAAE